MTMSEESETLEAPNWLSELEKKREHRLKARLGHEAGAGAPCIKCNTNCPGLDLHFWRKICKNCKCSKEDHDVHDDDIYGWAQFQLLGSKPNKVKKKIVLPGKKDEVELDWAPKGNTETIDRYLKTLAPESLPVKGSQAAQARKQLLQKQIPIHDIDPTLCHELTDSELAQMQDYIKHMKSSAGVGQVIQFGINYGNLHVINEANAKFVANRYPKGVPSMETVQLLGEKKSSTLTRQLEKLGVKDQQELDAFFDKIPNPHNMAAYSENVVPPYSRLEPQLQQMGNNHAPGQELASSLVPKSAYALLDAEAVYLPPLGPNFTTNLPPSGHKLGYANEINRNVTSSAASRYAREHILNVNEPKVEQVEGAEPNYVLANQDAEINRNLPHYAPAKYAVQSEVQKPTSVGNVRDLVYSTSNVDVANSNYSKGLPTFNPSQLRQTEDQVMPNRVNVGAIRDITYENPEIKSALQRENQWLDEQQAELQLGRNVVVPEQQDHPRQCRKCTKSFEPDEFAILMEKCSALYHSHCFRCAGCNQDLADLFYFYDRESDNIYCGRDFAKIRGIPRCKACDELIFVKEYCLAENSTFHLKHFCCFECDEALAGKDYLVEDSQPVCLPCYEKVKANKCVTCSRVIGAKEEGVALAEGIHFHTSDDCFCCQRCRKPLRGSNKLLFKNKRLYCSQDCFRADK